jgi:hypothetical protein
MPPNYQISGTGYETPKLWLLRDPYAVTLTAQPGVVVQFPPKEELMACKTPKKAAKKPAPKKK